MKRFILLLACVCASLFGYAASSTVYVGYPIEYDYVYQYDGFGGLDRATNIGAAIVVPQSMLKPYIGGRIKGLRIGWADPGYSPSATAFIRTSLNGENIVSGKGTVKSFTNGAWNTVNFTTPLDITEDLGPIYAGYTCRLNANSYGVSTMYPHGQAGSAYLSREGVNDKDGNLLWEDKSKDGTLSVQLIVETGGDADLLNNRATLSVLRNYPTGIKGQTSDGNVRVTNAGANAITSLTFTYACGTTTKTHTLNLTGSIAAGGSSTVNIPVYNCGTGNHTMTLSKVNGKENRSANTLEYYQIGIPATEAAKYTRRPLIEYVESENNYTSAIYYDNYLAPGYEGVKGKFSLLCPHIDDQYMTGNNDEIQMLLDLCDNDSMQVMTPSMMVDRSQSVIGIDNCSRYSPWLSVYLPDYVGPYYSAMLARPTFARVSVGTVSVDKEKAEASFTVSGNIAPDVLPADDGLGLVVFLVENEVESDSQLSDTNGGQDDPDEEGSGHNTVETIVHQNVARLRLTPLYGDAVGSSGNFQRTYTCALQNGWNTDNMRVLALLCQNPKNGGRWHGSVINSTEKALPKQGIIERTDTTAHPVLDDACFYGFSPLTVQLDDITAVGTNRNNYVEAAICLDTQNDPLLEQLRQAGATVRGLRVYLNHDYAQAAQGRSLIRARQGSTEAAPVAEKVCNFKKGWNDILFDTPVSIAQGKNFLGYQVFETIGSSHPVGSYLPATVPGSCYINPARQGFQNLTGRGTLLMQAIIEGGENLKNLQNAAFASFSGVTATMVHPSSPFDCTLYVRNLSAQPVSSIDFEGTDAFGNVNAYQATLPQPIPPFDGATMPYSLIAPAKEGIEQPLTLHVTKVDGQKATETLQTTGNLYVALDAYERVPLVEEFTSQYCVNCPFMIYYLDRAIEKYRKSGKPLLYVTHHSGFQYDRFTVEADRDLTYLFFGDEYNPAVMYDRRVLSTESTVVQSAKVAETEPYTTAITEAARYPAYAEVNIKPVKGADGTIGAEVSGSVNRYLLETGAKVYLSCYLVEDGIPVSSSYFQYGLEEEDGAPDDLQETFRHNGVIRCAYNKAGLGDELTIKQGDSYTYSMTYAPQSFRADTNLDNCDIIAFVHLVDKNDSRNNYVLNAGSARLQGYTLAGGEGIAAPQASDTPQTQGTYDLQGRRLSPFKAEREGNSRGLYIQNGRKVVM